MVQELIIQYVRLHYLNFVRFNNLLRFPLDIDTGTILVFDKLLRRAVSCAERVRLIV